MDEEGAGAELLQPMMAEAVSAKTPKSRIRRFSRLREAPRSGRRSRKAKRVAARVACGRMAADDAFVVVMVRVAVPAWLGVRLRFDGEKVQVVSDGRPEQAKAIEPENAAFALVESWRVPGWPGVTESEVEAELKVKSAGGRGGATEAEVVAVLGWKLPSPLYWKLKV